MGEPPLPWIGVLPGRVMVPLTMSVASDVPLALKATPTVALFPGVLIWKATATSLRREAVLATPSRLVRRPQRLDRHPAEGRGAVDDVEPQAPLGGEPRVHVRGVGTAGGLFALPVEGVRTHGLPFRDADRAD